MIIKMRKEVFISGTFVNAFRYDWDYHYGDDECESQY